ncbi:MAG: dihydropteroate synthase [Bacteroidota bacterium]
MSKTSINVNGKLLDLSTPKVMGILNITPDSFYSKSRFDENDIIIKQVKSMINDGMDIVDIGGYSSRPGAKHISEQEEVERVLPVIEIIHENFPDLAISIDTFRAKVAEKSVKTGAGIINDISAGEMDAKMFETVAGLKVPYIAMHMKGTPQNMQTDPVYSDIMTEILYYFSEKINRLHQLNVNDIILDPGFGFGKTVEHNYEILNKFELLHNTGLPILTGVSRKSMINRVLSTKPEDALNGTTVLNTIALTKGTQILRVHDVKEAKQAITLFQKIINS